MAYTMETSFLSFSPKIQPTNKKPKLTITGSKALVFGSRRKQKSITNHNISLSQNIARKQNVGSSSGSNKENETSIIILDDTTSSVGSIPENILDTIVLESSSDESSYDCVANVTKKCATNGNLLNTEKYEKNFDVCITANTKQPPINDDASPGTDPAVHGDKTKDIEVWLDDLRRYFNNRPLSSLSSFHNKKNDKSGTETRNITQQRHTSTEREDREDELFRPKVGRRMILKSESENDSDNIGTQSKKWSKPREKKPSFNCSGSVSERSDQSNLSLASVTSQEKILNDLYGGLWNKKQVLLTPNKEQTIGNILGERKMSSRDSVSSSDVSQTSVQKLLSEMYDEELNWKDVLTPIHKNKGKELLLKKKRTLILGGKENSKVPVPGVSKTGISLPKTSKHLYPPSSKDTSNGTVTHGKYRTVQTSPKFLSFLRSLSASPPLSQCDPKTLMYKKDFNRHKQTLCIELYKLFNKEVFDNKLPPDMRVDWNIRMNRTAGFCYNRWITVNGSKIRSAKIELATKVLTSADRVRDTLVHEMCHAATWIISGLRNGHGAVWKSWARKAMYKFPELPYIGRCHSYKIQTKYTYKCKRCGYSIGRHSKSIDLKLKRCGYCVGEFELLVNTKNSKGGPMPASTARVPRAAAGFALYVKENYGLLRQAKKDLKHADIMKLLGNQFAVLRVNAP